MTGRPAQTADEIEVTPEMIDAGLSVFTYSFLPLHMSLAPSAKVATQKA
jgi:hypothetical protein